MLNCSIYWKRCVLLFFGRWLVLGFRQFFFVAVKYLSLKPSRERVWLTSPPTQPTPPTVISSPYWFVASTADGLLLLLCFLIDLRCIWLTAFVRSHMTNLNGCVYGQLCQGWVWKSKNKNLWNPVSINRPIVSATCCVCVCVFSRMQCLHLKTTWLRASRPSKKYWRYVLCIIWHRMSYGFLVNLLTANLKTMYKIIVQWCRGLAYMHTMWSGVTNYRNGPQWTATETNYD